MLAARLLAPCVAGLVVAGCATVTPVGNEQIDPRYSLGGGEWNSGGGITIAVRTFERDGVVVVCGAWTMDRQSVLTSELNDNVVAAASVFVGGDRAVNNLSFMRLVPYSDNISGEQTNCVATDRPWKAGYSPASTRVRIPRMAFDLDEESGEYLVFRETPRAEIIR